MKPLPKPLSVAEIAALTGGQVVGDASTVIDGVAELVEAGPSHAASFHNPKYAGAAAASRAGCLFVPPQAKDAPGQAKARIALDDPQAGFAALVELIDAARRAKLVAAHSAKASIHYQAKLGPGVHVGDFAVIEKGAAIGEGTVVHPRVYVGENVKIGRSCVLYPGVVIREDCELGDRVIVQPGAVIGSDGFGYTTDRKTGRHRKVAQIGNVVIKDDVEVGANTTIDRAALGSTVIDSGTKIDNLVQLAHNVRVGKDCFFAAQVGIAGSVKIGDGVAFGGQVGSAGHITIGDRAQLGAQSGLMADVDPKSVLFGSPARPIREAFKLEALYGRLPELFERVKELEKKLGAPGKTDASAA